MNQAPEADATESPALELQFFATCPRGFADLLAVELAAMGAQAVKEQAGGVSFQGPLEAGYRACLESRIASRVLLQLARAPVGNADEFYEFARTIDWARHFTVNETLSCEFTGTHPAFRNTHFGALKLKDAICDQFRERLGKRPDVATDRSDIRIHAHAHSGAIALLLDFAGESLSQRGYRLMGGEAPLRENLAAGILMRSQWPRIAAEGGRFVDPMCGSGTLVIEAAWMALNIAPGLLRGKFGFQKWWQHDETLWQRLLEAARERANAVHAARDGAIQLYGSDQNRAAIATARANARRAGVDTLIEFAQGEADIWLGEQGLAVVGDATASPEAAAIAGLLCANPPYGERLGEDQEATAAHESLGRLINGPFAHWHAAVLTGTPALGQKLGAEASRVHEVWNGAIECRLLRFLPGQRRQRRPQRAGVMIDDATLANSPGAQMFANRLRKNLKHLGKQARREAVSSWRLYDADMPEYSLAIDLYAGAGPDAERRWLHVQEYAAPDTIDATAAKRRREEALSVLPEVTGVPFEEIRLRVRRKQKDGGQYRKRDDRAQFRVVEEAGLKLQVNLDDFLDTGLFLDHRLTRQRLGAAARGKRFLNLFCYTGTATVHAVAGGAKESLSIDLSRTYLDWAERNLALNGLVGPQHQFLQADCLEWLAAAAPRGPAFDLIFLDPPTFSNSARMQDILDTNRDHAQLIEHCMSLLKPAGLLVFSTNAQRFALDPSLSLRWSVADISAATLPFDFKGNPRIHRCFELRSKA